MHLMYRCIESDYFAYDSWFTYYMLQIGIIKLRVFVMQNYFSNKNSTIFLQSRLLMLFWVAVPSHLQTAVHASSPFVKEHILTSKHHPQVTMQLQDCGIGGNDLFAKRAVDLFCKTGSRKWLLVLERAVHQPYFKSRYRKYKVKKCTSSTKIKTIATLNVWS